MFFLMTQVLMYFKDKPCLLQSLAILGVLLACSNILIIFNEDNKAITKLTLLSDRF